METRPNPDPSGSVTRLIHRLQSGDSSLTDEAARQIWERYFPRLLSLARRHLDSRIRARHDEEDLLQSVGKSIFRRLERGDFDLAGRDDLWALLVTVTLNKARNAADYYFAEKRRPDREQRLSLSDGSWSNPSPANGASLVAGGPSSAEAAELADQLEHRLRSLETVDDPDLRPVAELKLEGYTNREIADKMGFGSRTVERKLALIRRRWTPEFDEPSGETTPGRNPPSLKSVSTD